MLKKFLLPLNLQFFAESEYDNKNIDNSDNKDDLKDEPDDEPEEKMFTQTQLKRMLTKEKREGKRSVLKQLGFESEEEAKSAFKLLNALMDSQKGDDEKLKDEKNKSSKDKKELEDRAFKAECKLSLFMAGVNKDSINDVLTIALSKMDEDDNLDDVLKEMKKEKRYAMFFNSDSSDDSEDDTDKGTGRRPENNHKKRKDEMLIGERLAKQDVNKTKKTSYFSEEV